MTWTFADGGDPRLTQANEAGQSITAVADGGSNTLTISVTAHGYAAGDLVYISGTTSYNGAYLINSVNTNDFNIPDTTTIGVQNAWGVTETGTAARGDKDLSGLTGLTNVTTTVLGSVTEYTLDATRIIVDGSLYFNARTERIRYINISAFVSPAFYCNNSNSYLAIVSQESVNGTDEVFPYQLAIDFGDADAGFSAGGVGGLSVNNGSAFLQGMFNFENGAAVGYRVFGNTGGDFTCDRLVIHDLADAGNTQLRIGGGGSNSVDNCVSICCSVTLAASAVFASFSGNVVKQNNEAIVLNQNILGGYQVFTDFEDNNAGVLLRHNSSGNVQHAKFINYIGGAGITYNNSDAGVDFNRVVAIKKVDVAPEDENGASISASYYAIDTDNGNRGPDYVENSTAISWACSGDLEYTGTTASATIDLVTAFANQDGVIDNRGENANGDITFNWFKYGRQFSTVRPSVLGTGSVTSAPVLLPDASITEATKATVDAYTTLDTTAQLYDRHAAFLEDDLSNGIYLAFFLTKSGTVIGAGTLAIEIDASAASVFAYNGSKVTLKSSAYTGGFSTSGIITQLNGATISNLTLEGGATWNAVQSTWTGSAGATETIDVQATGTYDATGFTFDAATTLNNDTGGVVDIVISNGQQQPTVVNGVGASTNFLNAGATVTFNNLTSANVQIIQDDNTTVAQRSTAQTGTLVYNTPDGSSGTWCYVINREGYEPIVGTYTADGGDVTVNATQTQKLLNDGSVMYQGTSSALLSVTTQADGSRMNLRIGDGAVSAQAIFDEVEVALMTQDGMTYLCNSGGEVAIALLPTGTFVFMGANVRVIRDTAPDANATINAFVQSTDGIVLDNTNGAVQFVTPNSDVNVVSVTGTNVTDVNDFKADVSLLATQASVDTVDTVVDAIKVTTDANLDATVSSRATPAQVATELATYDAPTKAELDTAQAAIIAEVDANEVKIDAIETKAQADARQALLIAEHDATQATLAGLNDITTAEIRTELSTELARIDVATSTRSTFNHAVDVVANVTLVDTVTTNTDMRGTDGANTTAPDNASIAAILVDTNELQTNQGNWLTATGFATSTQATNILTQATLARKHLTNRDKIDDDNNTLIRYDDDGTTPLVTFDLKDADGVATSTTVYEKVPQ